jgi:hypothetical protein
MRGIDILTIVDEQLAQLYQLETWLQFRGRNFTKTCHDLHPFYLFFIENNCKKKNPLDFSTLHP